MSERRIVEINGIKMELDERTGKVSSIDTFAVGDSVMLLIEEGYSDKVSRMKDGVITGFGNFEENPTIMVTYLDSDYSSCSLKTICYNKHSKDIQLIKSEFNTQPFNMTVARTHLQQSVLNKEAELEKAKKILTDFDTFFGMIMSEAEAKTKNVE